MLQQQSPSAYKTNSCSAAVIRYTNLSGFKCICYYFVPNKLFWSNLNTMKYTSIVSRSDENIIMLKPW
jgi:hypothetical protein